MPDGRWITTDEENYLLRRIDGAEMATAAHKAENIGLKVRMEGASNLASELFNRLEALIAEPFGLAVETLREAFALSRVLKNGILQPYRLPTPEIALRNEVVPADHNPTREGEELTIRRYSEMAEGADY